MTSNASEITVFDDRPPDLAAALHATLLDLASEQRTAGISVHFMFDADLVLPSISPRLWLTRRDRPHAGPLLASVVWKLGMFRRVSMFTPHFEELRVHLMRERPKALSDEEMRTLQGEIPVNERSDLVAFAMSALGGGLHEDRVQRCLSDELMEYGVDDTDPRVLYTKPLTAKVIQRLEEFPTRRERDEHNFFDALSILALEEGLANGKILRFITGSPAVLSVAHKYAAELPASTGGLPKFVDNPKSAYRSPWYVVVRSVITKYLGQDDERARKLGSALAQLASSKGAGWEYLDDQIKNITNDVGLAQLAEIDGLRCAAESVGIFKLDRSQIAERSRSAHARLKELGDAAIAGDLSYWSATRALWRHADARKYLASKNKFFVGENLLIRCLNCGWRDFDTHVNRILLLLEDSESQGALQVLDMLHKLKSEELKERVLIAVWAILGDLDGGRWLFEPRSGRSPSWSAAMSALLLAATNPLTERTEVVQGRLGEVLATVEAVRKRNELSKHGGVVALLAYGLVHALSRLARCPPTAPWPQLATLVTYQQDALKYLSAASMMLDDAYLRGRGILRMSVGIPEYRRSILFELRCLLREAYSDAWDLHNEEHAKYLDSWFRDDQVLSDQAGEVIRKLVMNLVAASERLQNTNDAAEAQDILYRLRNLSRPSSPSSVQLARRLEQATLMDYMRRKR